ncbi:biotin synthase BioB [Clostridioides difficile]
MNLIDKYKEKIKEGYLLEKDDINQLLTAPLKELCEAANEIREYFCGNSFDMCTIINGKSGKCSENCKFCAQSIHFKTAIEEYPLLDKNTVLKDATYNDSKGVLRYSIVTSGKRLSSKDLENLCNSYKLIRENLNISLCASHGLLSYDDFIKLKESGVTRYHNNLETSRKFFPSICTTHSYEDKIETIKAAQKAGLEVCSGGILGLGESIEDRIDMALELRSLGIKSIPINVLNPIKGTPLENNKIVSNDEIKRTIAIFRFIIPYGAIRLAGGRGLIDDKAKSLFEGGANATITGDMLTTTGICIDDDIDMIKSLKYKVAKL